MSNLVPGLTEAAENERCHHGKVQHCVYDCISAMLATEVCAGRMHFQHKQEVALLLWFSFPPRQSDFSVDTFVHALWEVPHLEKGRIFIEASGCYLHQNIWKYVWKHIFLAWCDVHLHLLFSLNRSTSIDWRQSESMLNIGVYVIPRDSISCLM